MLLNAVFVLANQIALFQFPGEAIICDIERCFPAKVFDCHFEVVGLVARLITYLLRVRSFISQKYCTPTNNELALRARSLQRGRAIFFDNELPASL